MAAELHIQDNNRLGNIFTRRNIRRSDRIIHGKFSIHKGSNCKPCEKFEDRIMNKTKTRIMKKTFLLAFIAVSFSVIAQEKTPYMTKSLSGESVKSTEVQTSGGSISVTGVNSAAETKVEVYISSNMGRENSLSKE